MVQRMSITFSVVEDERWILTCLLVSQKYIFVNILGNRNTYGEFIVLNLFTWFALEHPDIKPLLFPLKKNVILQYLSFHFHDIHVL